MWGVHYSISMPGYDTEEIEIDVGFTTITKGLRNEIFNGLKNISKENVSVIVD